MTDGTDCLPDSQSAHSMGNTEAFAFSYPEPPSRDAYSAFSRAGGMFTNARDNYQVISLVVEAEAHKFVLSILFVSPHR